MSVSGPQASTHNTQDSRGKGSNVLLASWRKRRRLGIALIVSLFFHLSMITVFKIVIALPREQVSYYDVHLVYSAPAERTDVAQHLPRSEDTLSLTGTALYGELPEVELPVVEFAELERLRIRFDAAQADPGADRMFEAYAPSDSWARFGSELQRFGKTLREFAFPGDGAADTTAAQIAQTTRVQSHRPAEGFEAYIEWNGPPADRELLFAPPIQALWGVNPDRFDRPIEMVFKVDANGKVENVWSPHLENSTLLDDVQMAVLRYRFAPLTDSTAEQSGVLVILAAEAGS
ncbi:MAG: hypothetical protein ACOYI9_11815 [Candidatus Hydrogenedentales bacterium]|jgi:hypothetical protein